MSQTSRRRSSARPRSSVIGTCVCALTRPGLPTRPPQSTVAAAVYRSASAPTAAIASPVIATEPLRWIVNRRSIVSTMALVSRRSQVGTKIRSIVCRASEASRIPDTSSFSLARYPLQRVSKRVEQLLLPAVELALDVVAPRVEFRLRLCGVGNRGERIAQPRPRQLHRLLIHEVRRLLRGVALVRRLIDLPPLLVERRPQIVLLLRAIRLQRGEPGGLRGGSRLPPRVERHLASRKLLVERERFADVVETRAVVGVGLLQRRRLRGVRCFVCGEIPLLHVDEIGGSAAPRLDLCGVEDG